MAEDARPNLPLRDLVPASDQAEKADPGDLDSGADRGRLEEAARRTRAKANRYAARYLGDGLQGEEILEHVLQFGHCCRPSRQH